MIDFSTAVAAFFAILSVVFGTIALSAPPAGDVIDLDKLDRFPEFPTTRSEFKYRRPNSDLEQRLNGRIKAADVDPAKPVDPNLRVKRRPAADDVIYMKVGEGMHSPFSRSRFNDPKSYQGNRTKDLRESSGEVLDLRSPADSAR